MYVKLILVDYHSTNIFHTKLILIDDDVDMKVNVTEWG